MSNDRSPWGCLVRLFWMIVGYGVLVLLAAQMVGTGRAFSVLDLGFGATVLLVIAARFVDIRFFDGRDEFGNPATMSDWRRHAIWVISIAALVWLAIRLIAFLRG